MTRDNCFELISKELNQVKIHKSCCQIKGQTTTGGKYVERNFDDQKFAFLLLQTETKNI